MAAAIPDGVAPYTRTSAESVPPATGAIAPHAVGAGSGTGLVGAVHAARTRRRQEGRIESYRPRYIVAVPSLHPVRVLALHRIFRSAPAPTCDPGGMQIAAVLSVS